jgi:hypothetical protein
MPGEHPVPPANNRSEKMAQTTVQREQESRISAVDMAAREGALRAAYARKQQEKGKTKAVNADVEAARASITAAGGDPDAGIKAAADTAAARAARETKAAVAAEKARQAARRAEIAAEKAAEKAEAAKVRAAERAEKAEARAAERAEREKEKVALAERRAAEKEEKEAAKLAAKEEANKILAVQRVMEDALYNASSRYWDDAGNPGNADACRAAMREAVEAQETWLQLVDAYYARRQDSAGAESEETEETAE